MEKCTCILIYYHIIEHYHILMRSRNRVSMNSIYGCKLSLLIIPLKNNETNTNIFHSPLNNNLMRLIVINEAVFIASSKISEKK
jgi:hypothetical protein